MKTWGVALPLAVVVACGSSDNATSSTTATCPPSDGGGVATTASAPPGCDPNADAKDSVACADDSFALFVNVDAPDGGDGTKAKPLRSVTSALGKVAASGKRRVYICGASTLPEHVSLDATNAAALIGGFDCASWQPVSGMKAKLAPPDAGYALHIDTVLGDVRVQDLAFESIAGTAASRSSITVFVASSPNVTFTRVDIKANDGFAGTDGTPGMIGSVVSGTLDGNTPVDDARGAPAKTCACVAGGSSVGGRGGDEGGATVDGEAGQPSYSPAEPSGATGAGATQAGCNAVPQQFGSRGSDAPQGADGVTSGSAGVLDRGGWTPADGQAGANGAPGQGGGGAGSRTNGGGTQNAGGASGACGGCGGSGGGAGTAAGSSIGILSFESSLRISSSVVAAGAGGRGGTGKPGGLGMLGGIGGTRFHQSCQGGDGGTGGAGGGGSGGAGGLAVAVLYKGAAPTNEGSVLTNGVHGHGGAGASTTSTRNDGAEGLEGQVVAAP